MVDFYRTLRLARIVMKVTFLDKEIWINPSLLPFYLSNETAGDYEM